MLSNSAEMLASSSPARRALASQRSSSNLQPLVRGDRFLREGPGDERSEPRAAGGEALVLELAVRLEDGVRIDRHLTDHVLDGRELITLAQQPEVEGLAHLVDELAVRRHPGVGVDAELDHPHPPFN